MGYLQVRSNVSMMYYILILKLLCDIGWQKSLKLDDIVNFCMNIDEKSYDKGPLHVCVSLFKL